MDGFELNKIVAAILIALIVVKGADLISEELLHPKTLKHNAYKIEGVTTTAQSGDIASGKKGPPPIDPLLATASLERGAEIFKKCTSCHTIDKGGSNRIGPNLYGIVGKVRGKHPGYFYSSAMEKGDHTWTYSELNEYLYSPRNFVPGTKMSFAGIKDDKDRAALIAYLRMQSENPAPLPPPPPQGEK